MSGALVLLLMLGAPRPPAPPADPIALLLAEEDYDGARPALLEALRREGRGCERLDGYATDRNERVREHAVHALADAACDDFAAYRPYLDDPSPWVQRAVFESASRLRIGAAVPFMVRRLTDPRMMLSDDGSMSVGEAAHRSLRVLSCQSFHFDPHGPPAGQADAAAQWTSWYAAHRGEPREKWVAEGIALAGDYLGRDYAPHRIEGLELLALIGPPGLTALREGFARGAGDLRATLSCSPDEPPRVLDRIPCALEVVNASRRRVALAPAPGDPEIQLQRVGATGPEGPPSRPSREPAGAAARGPAPAPRDGVAAAAARLPGAIVDLTPGQVIRREFMVGPVATAGRYEVRAVLIDRAEALWEAAPPPPPETGAAEADAPSPRRATTRPGTKPPRKAPPPPRAGRPAAAGLPAIEASTILRFEQ